MPIKITICSILTCFTFWEPVKGTPVYIDLGLKLIDRHLSDAFRHVHLNLGEARKRSPRIDEFLKAAEPRSIGKSTFIESRKIALFTCLLRIELLQAWWPVGRCGYTCDARCSSTRRCCNELRFLL